MNDPISVQVVSARVDGVEGRLDRHEKVHEKLWAKFNKVENRLPNWALALISLLSAATAALVRSLF